MTYRPGRSWRVTIVDEQPDGDRLHAVVMAGKVLTTDPELAEHVCELLNAVTPDVTHTHGAAEALAEVRRLLANWEALRDTGELFTPAMADAILREAARELGVDEDAPSGPLSAPVSAEQPPVGGSGRPDGAETLSGPCRYPECECDTDTPCGVTTLTFNPAYRVARCGQGSTHGPHVVDHGPDQPRNCRGTGPDGGTSA